MSVTNQTTSGWLKAILDTVSYTTKVETQFTENTK